MLGSPKFWILLIVIPFFALIPDLTILMFTKIFYPNPTDAVLRLQSGKPGYVYDGFDAVKRSDTKFLEMEDQSRKDLLAIKDSARVT